MTREYWEGLIGSKIDDKYLLGKLIGCTEESAVFLTAHGEQDAALKLRVPELRTPVIPHLDHPQIIRLFATGRCDLDGATYDYFVTEAADENLANVIAARALTTDETREMLGPLLEGLSYLHERSLAHGRVKPSNVLACGESVKLSVDSIRPVGATVAPDEDMRALGLLIIECLTQERQPSSIAEVPQPFRDIVDHSLQLDPALRWSARQSLLRLSGVTPSAPVAASAPQQTKATKASFIPVWVYPAAAVVLLGVWFGLGRSGSTSASSNAPLPAPVVVPAQPAPQAPKPTPFEKKVVPATAPKSGVVNPTGVKPTGAKPTGQGWFVVVASYTREPDAEKEARTLGRQFPQFKLSVFPPSAIDTHYLVLVGSGLSADGAETLRQRAVVAGLPPDTYIKKYPTAH